jgi:type II secretory pathway component PulK
MTEPLERDAVIGLLNRLGSDQDEEVLDAARQVHAQITAADMTWEELLVPDEVADDDTDDIDTDDDDAEYQDTEDEIPEPPAEAAGKNTDSLALIDELLAKSGISEDLREELKGYKTDIAEGEFQEADRRYLRAVHQRLSKRRS